jgi:hypothetical protein
LAAPVQRLLQGSDSVAPDSRQGGPSRYGTHQARPLPMRANEAAALPSPQVVLSCGSSGTTTASDALRHPPLPGSTPVIGRRFHAVPQCASAGEGLPSSRRHPLSVPCPHTPGSPSRLHLQDLHRFHGLHREPPGSALPRYLTTRQGFANAPDRSVAPPLRAFDAGLRPGPFPDQAASLLPGLLAATRTGLPPVGDDELPIRS